MADETSEEPLSWYQPVYREELKRGVLENFAVCKHCKQIRLHHVGEEQKCLFDSSTFAVLRNPKK